MIINEMSKTDKKEKNCVLKNFNVVRLDEININNSKNKIYNNGGSEIFK